MIVVHARSKLTSFASGWAFSVYPCAAWFFGRCICRPKGMDFCRSWHARANRCMSPTYATESFARLGIQFWYRGWNGFWQNEESIISTASLIHKSELPLLWSKSRTDCYALLSAAKLRILFFCGQSGFVPILGHSRKLDSSVWNRIDGVASSVTLPQSSCNGFGTRVTILVAVAQLR